MNKSIKAIEKEISIELRLVAILSLPHLDEEQIKKAGKLINLADFNRTKTLVRHYRVWPCVYCNVRDHFSTQFPLHLTSWLKRKYENNIDRSKQQFMEITKLLHEFRKVGISAQPLKGTFLAQTLYGDIAKRHASDIDIIVDHSRIDETHDLLKSMGYESDCFSTLPEYLREIYFSRHKDITYTNQQGVVLEVHTRLQAHSGLLSRNFSQKLISYELSNEELFIYLCWHNASTLHHRLKWLTDLVIFIERNNLSWGEVYRISNELDSSRCVTVNLVLISLIYDVKLPEEARRYFSFDSAAYNLCFTSLVTLNEMVIPNIFHQKNIAQREFQLVTRPISKLRVVMQVMKPSMADILFLPSLPRRVCGLYYFARPISLFIRSIIILKQKRHAENR